MPDSSNPFEELEQPAEVDDSASQQEPDLSTGDDGSQGSQPSAPSSQGSSTPSAKGLLGTLDPTVPPTPNDWPKVFQAMKAMEGRVRTSQQAQGRVAPEIQQKVEAFDAYFAIPGIKDVLRQYFDATRSRGGSFDIRELFQGNAQQQQAPGRQPQQQGSGEDWLGLTPQNFNDRLRSMVKQIAEEQARGIADPLFQQVGSMKMEAEMSALQAKYPDASKYADQIDQLVRRNTNLNAEDAYFMAKGRQGGFGRPRPNAQAAFSEGAGSRGEASMQVDEGEQIARDMMKAGYNGRL